MTDKISKRVRDAVRVAAENREDVVLRAKHAVLGADPEAEHDDVQKQAEAAYSKEFEQDPLGKSLRWIGGWAAIAGTTVAGLAEFIDSGPGQALLGMFLPEYVQSISMLVAALGGVLSVVSKLKDPRPVRGKAAK